MGMKDFFKKMVNLPADDEYEDDYYDEEEPSFFDEDEPEEKSVPASKPKKEITVLLHNHSFSHHSFTSSMWGYDEAQGTKSY